MFDFILYQEPKKALFNSDGGIYTNGSWSKQKETIVIGEDNDLYIEQIKNEIGIGFHKSRLIKWLPTQTNLF